MNTVSAVELAARVRRHHCRCSTELAEMFLAEWMASGVVEEPVPGRFRLSSTGRARFGDVFDGLDVDELDDGAMEVAA